MPADESAECAENERVEEAGQQDGGHQDRSGRIVAADGEQERARDRQREVAQRDAGTVSRGDHRGLRSVPRRPDATEE